MEEIIYGVYVKLDSNNCIISVESTAFNTKEGLQEKDYICIDSGIDSKIYAHAQPNYLMMKYGKSIIDLEGNYNYRLEDLKPVLLTEEEKRVLFSKVEPKLFEEIQNDINIDLDYRITLLELGV